MNSNYYKRCLTSDKQYHFSIRKLNVGVVSVAISAFMFLSGTVALADSNSSNEPTTVQVEPTTNSQQDVETESKDDTSTETNATDSTNDSENTLNETQKTEAVADETTQTVADIVTQENDSASQEGGTSQESDVKTDVVADPSATPTDDEMQTSTSETNTPEEVTNDQSTEETKTSEQAQTLSATEPTADTATPLADTAQTEEGYTVSEPTAPINDPVEGRYTYQVVQDDQGIQYIFSIDKDATSAADLMGNNTARYIYLTRMQNGQVLSSERIDRMSEAGTKFDYNNTNINLLTGSKILQINSIDNQRSYRVLYNALSTISPNPAQTVNISTVRFADQVTKYVNELTGEVIHEEYIQSGWTGYKYTTEPIEIEYYKFDHATDNTTGVVSTAVPRNKGDIVYLTAQATVDDGGKNVPVRIYRKFEFIDDNQTAKVTIYMTPRVDEGEETDAETFFKNMENYTIYNNKIYTSATDLTQKTNSGVTFSDLASNDKNGYYLARPYADTPDDKTPIQVFFETSPLTTQKVDESKRFTLPYADTGILIGDGVNNRLSSPNRKAVFSTVVYYYVPQGEVVVNYVDTDGNVIKDPVADTPLTEIQVDGKPVEYNTTDKRENTIKTPDGKTYKYKEIKDGSAPETGELKQGKQEVTYVYEEVKGDVVVLYRTEDGKELTGIGSDYEGQPDKTVTIGNITDTETAEKRAWNGAVIDTPTGSTGVDYTTLDSRPETITTADGLVYKRIARVAGNETGKVVEGTTRIVYYYEAQKGGTVNARYVIEGTEDELQPPVEVKGEGTQVGTEYTATKPQTIVKDGKTYVLSTTMPIRNNAGDAPETGRVTQAPQTVVYQYVLHDPRGDVTIHYEDEDGNVIKDPVKDEENTAVGTPYDTTDEGDKPTRITTEDGKTYEIVPDKTKGEETGTVTEGNTDVTYVYREIKGDVVVTYVDEDGNVIKDQVVDTPASSTGTDYDTSEHAQKIITTADGKRYILVKAGNYPVGAVDAAGHLVISDATTGKVTEGTKTVTYVYQELGSYIPYIPEKPGDPYDPTNPGTDEPKVPYDDTPEEPGDNPPLPYIPGYTPKDPDGNPLKPVDPDDPTKGYIPPPITDPNDPGKDTPVPYEKDPETPPEVKQGDVVVKYINEAGETIAPDVTDTPSSDVGTAYDTTDNKPKIITSPDGKRYIFTRVQAGDNETGEVKEGTTTVTYIYKELGSYIPYIPEKPGDPYDPTNPGTDEPKVPYDDTPEEPGDNPPLPYIPGYTPKDPDGNPLKPVDPDDPTKGYIPPPITDPNDPGKDTPVPYEKDPETPPEVKQGDVVVKYINEAGETIAPDVTDTPSSDVGTAYDTTDNKPKIITSPDGKRYIFTRVRAGDNETGEVKEGTTTVTYIYKELGSYIPYIPEKPGDPYDPTNPGTDEPKVPYDDTPEEPGDNPPLPYIPGYTPKDPDGNPLKPVDPDDPTKGYIPPPITDPNDPGKDTPVPYEKDPETPPEVKQGDVVVKYTNEAGETIAPDVTDTPSSDVGTAYDTTDNKPKIITSPDGKRYIFTRVQAGDNETGEVKEGTTTVTYIYKELGSYIPYIPEKPGDPYDPTNPGTDEPKVPYDDTPEEPGDNPPLPYIPGYTPKDPDGNPLKPVDPDDPTKGYIPPPITDPNDPGKDTPVPYEKDPETPPEVKQGDVVVKYVNEAGETIAPDVTDTPSSDVGTAYDTTDNKPKIITSPDGKRYIFTRVQAGDNETGEVKEGTTTVTYIYKELGSYIPYIPTEPGKEIPEVPYDDTPEEPGDNPPLPYIPGYTPKDPDGNPLKPVDPDDPTKGYIPPPITDPKDPGKDTPVPYEKDPETPPEVKQGDVVVKYINEAGETIAPDVTDTPSSDVGTAYDTTDNKPKIITSPDGKRYIFTRVQAGDNETGEVKEGTTTVTYIYKELGSYIPYIPTEPGKDIPEVPYDDTPEEPGDNPPLPYIPGYTPKDPDGNPLKPVDPDDPTKGYIPPPITDPKDPGKDTPVPYEKDPETPPTIEDKGSVIVHYVDEKGNVIKDPVDDETDVVVGTSYDTTDNKPKIITSPDGKRYIFTRVQTGDNETGTVQKGTTTVTYIYKELGSYIPYIPTEPGKDIPEVPYDDTPEEPGDNPPLPYIPGYTPKDPDGNPLKPVDPDDPTKGYIPPPITDPKDPGKDTPVPYEKDPETPPTIEDKGSVIVHYVDEKGNVIKDPVDDETDVVVGTSYDTTDNKPKIITSPDGKRYIFTRVQTGDNETGTVQKGTTTVTYIYKELGSYIPYIPTEPGKDIPEVPYDDTPEEPGDNPPLPYIPGYTPKDPDGNPLKPVDPDDPTKGYIPPPITDPKDPGKDTPVPYEKDPETPPTIEDKGSIIVHYVDEKGNVIKDPVDDETDVVVGTSYDTTDNKPKIITSPDGKRYIFMRVQTGDNETGTVQKGTTTVTYIYKELGSYIPYIPTEPGKEIPKVPYDDTPEVPGDNPPLPYIPGYTPKDPNGNPLKPVDPDDPTKGYIPPPITDPNDPSKDTPVPYEKDPVVKEESSPEKTEPNKKVSTNVPQEPPTQTDNVRQMPLAGKELPSVNKPGKTSQQSLPQTGDENESIFSSLGMLAIALSALGLFAYRKKEDKE